MRILEQLKAIQYTDAQEHYMKLRSEFLQQYNSIAQRTEQELMDEFFHHFDDLSDVANQQETSATIMKILSEKVKERLKASNTDAVYGAQQNQTANQVFKTIDIKTAKKQIEEFSQQLISEQELKEILLSTIPFDSRNGADYTDLLNNMRGAVNKILKAKTLRTPSLKAFERSAKGYLREILVHEMLAEFNKKLTNQFWGNNATMHAGAKKGKKGLDTPYDHWIDLFHSADRSFEAHVKYDLNLGYGFQTKSWITPWSEGANKYSNRFAIGSRKAVFDDIMQKVNNFTLNNTNRWLASLRMLEKRFKEIIGPRQVGYFTGNKFYWTCDLIREFRMKEYFYNFVYKKDGDKAVPTPSIAWQQYDANWYQNH